jgi:hypothetical protein
VNGGSDAEVEPRVLLVQLLDGGVDRERRPDGSLRVVLVRHGRAEEPHDRVADELLDRAAEALDLRAHARVVGGEARMDVLRIELLGRRRRADDVGEERRDDFPLLLGHGRNGRDGCRDRGGAERRSALEAELRPFGILRAAGGTGGHVSSVRP